MRRIVPLATLALVLAGCAGSSESALTPEVAARLDALDAAVEAWSSATSVGDAHQAAEEARNLVVGPAGPLYGDADRDGLIEGETGQGLLPGLDGSPGIVAEPAANACVERDVLGGSWEQPEARWDEALAAIDAWEPEGNTFPSLPSHPQRTVGWASLTLATDDLDTAVEYAGHARLHVDVTRAAFDDCDG
ncbi:hypothetical protein [Demequina gelatinilytica]|uniref:hypothetical protein n=1 Tax=Demequina gelatinilytica TaxID=1638980 RepID=UPI000AC15D00|nr:hypothetical protein [Demequina gelatinilytica]